MIAPGWATLFSPSFFVGYKMCKSNVSIAPNREGHSIKEVEKLRDASTVHTIYRRRGEKITRENKKLEGG